MADSTDDIVIIGGGPCGLTVALYAAREGMTCRVIEAKVIGGMAAVTEHIDNYPGFRNGIGGLQLADEMYQQALRFGASVELGVMVSDIAPQNGLFAIKTSAETYHGRTVVIATGSDYRRLGVPGESELIGRGIHFCATCDAPFYKDKAVLVVGGGNSAVQESIFLSKFASSVEILVRGDHFKASEALVNELCTKANVTVQYNSSVVEVVAKDSTFYGLKVATPEGETVKTADGVFVFIGLIPNAGFAPCRLDKRGFIVTDNHYMTSIAGMFACGDIRSGSTWQIASAVGEGAAAVLSVRDYLHKSDEPARSTVQAQVGNS